MALLKSYLIPDQSKCLEWGQAVEGSRGFLGDPGIPGVQVGSERQVTASAEVFITTSSLIVKTNA